MRNISVKNSQVGPGTKTSWNKILNGVQHTGITDATWFVQLNVEFRPFGGGIRSLCGTPKA